ncbi:MAG: hypothetical protein HY873_07630 [Chloroflexi bacterium]|nr:hypothetical protein [Chloroflexota bacterium]
MMRKTGWALMAASVVVLSIAFAACSDNEDDGDGGGVTPGVNTPRAGGDATTPTSSTPGQGGSEAGSATIAATAKDFSFSLDKASIQKEATVEVELMNTGSAPHTLTFYTDEEYSDPVPGGDSGNVSAGASANFSFQAPSDGDEVYYRCEVHPTQMKGEIGLE